MSDKLDYYYIFSNNVDANKIDGLIKEYQDIVDEFKVAYDASGCYKKVLASLNDTASKLGKLGLISSNDNRLIEENNRITKISERINSYKDKLLKGLESFDVPEELENGITDVQDDLEESI